MEILLKVSVPDKILKDINVASAKLGHPETTWWDVLYQSFEQVAEIYKGNLEFVKVRRDGNWLRRLTGMLRFRVRKFRVNRMDRRRI